MQVTSRRKDSDWPKLVSDPSVLITLSNLSILMVPSIRIILPRPRHPIRSPPNLLAQHTGSDRTVEVLLRGSSSGLSRPRLRSQDYHRWHTAGHHPEARPRCRPLDRQGSRGAARLPGAAKLVLLEFPMQQFASPIVGALCRCFHCLNVVAKGSPL